jgi:hypothetical protein
VWMMNNFYENCRYWIWSEICSYLIPWSLITKSTEIEIEEAHT